MPQFKRKLNVFLSYIRILTETIQVVGESLLHRVIGGLIPPRLCPHWHSAHWVTLVH